MIVVLKKYIKKEFNLKAKNQKKNLLKIQKELMFLEKENNNILDKITITNSAFVLQGLEKKIELNIQKINQIKEDMKNTT